MSFTTLLFLAIRALHVLLAATWLGSVALMVLFVMPAVEKTGPAAGPLMRALAERGLNAFFGVLGGVTALTGFYLYWRFTGHFDPAQSASRGAMVLGTGGIAGILAVILGGAVVGRNMAKMAALAAKAMGLPEGPERASLMVQSAAARARGSAGARIVLVLQLTAIVCMAIGRYL